jgi:hypothetical protein
VENSTECRAQAARSRGCSVRAALATKSQISTAMNTAGMPKITTVGRQPKATIMNAPSNGRGIVPIPARDVGWMAAALGRELLGQQAIAHRVLRQAATRDRSTRRTGATTVSAWRPCRRRR